MDNIVDNSIKCGDIVKTSKHEYKMTVHDVEKNIITCDYFDDSKKFYRETYSIEDLTIIP